MPPVVPAINHLKELDLLLCEPRFPIISFDTSFVLTALVDGFDYHNQCVKFIEALKTIQPIIIYSELLREELWCANLIREIKEVNKMPHLNVKDYLKKYRGTPRAYHGRTEAIDKKFDELLQNFTFRESIPVTRKITAEALKLINKYNLLGADAIHIATMLYNPIERTEHIAVFDAHMENITDLTVWTVGGKERYVKHHYKDWGFKDCPVSVSGPSFNPSFIPPRERYNRPE